MWGLPPDAHIDREVILSAIHPDDRPVVEAAIARALDPNGDGQYAAEYRVIGIQDRVERWVTARGCTFFDDGKPVEYLGTAMEITERKRLEKEILEIGERERRRIGRDLHDDLCQQLTGIAFSTGSSSSGWHVRFHLRRRSPTRSFRQCRRLRRGHTSWPRGCIR